MNKELLEILLRLAGLLLCGLVVANFVAAKRLRYAESLAGSEALVRQIFYVHSAYIIGIIASLALLCLAWPQMLLDGSMGRVVSSFFGVFWLSRVVVQLTYYDKARRGHDRGWDVFFLGVFLCLGAVFTMAAIYQ